MSVAGVAHPVERHLAKVEVASSSLVTRSIKKEPGAYAPGSFFIGRMMRWLEPSQCKSPVDSCLAGRAPPTPYNLAKSQIGNEPRHPPDAADF